MMFWASFDRRTWARQERVINQVPLPSWMWCSRRQSWVRVELKKRLLSGTMGGPLLSGLTSARPW